MKVCWEWSGDDKTDRLKSYKQEKIQETRYTVHNYLRGNSDTGKNHWLTKNHYNGDVQERLDLQHSLCRVYQPHRALGI